MSITYSLILVSCEIILIYITQSVGFGKNNTLAEQKSSQAVSFFQKHLKHIFLGIDEKLYHKLIRYLARHKDSEWYFRFNVTFLVKMVISKGNPFGACFSYIRDRVINVSCRLKLQKYVSGADMIAIFPFCTLVKTERKTEN